MQTQHKSEEKFLFDTSIHDHLLKEGHGSQSILDAAGMFASKIGDGNTIVTPFAALELIGFKFKEIPADYELSDEESQSLRGLLSEEYADYGDSSLMVLGSMLKFYKDKLKNIRDRDGNFIFSNEYLEKCSKAQRKYINEISLHWYDKAICPAISSEELDHVITRVALDRVMQTRMDVAEKYALQLVYLIKKYQRFSYLSNTGSFRIAQDFFENHFVVRQLQMASESMRTIENARLKSKTDYLDAESITYLTEGYLNNKIIYFTTEPKEVIKCRLEVAKLTLDFLNNTEKLNIDIKLGKVVFFTRDISFKESMDINSLFNPEG